MTHPPRVVLGVSGGIAAYKAIEVCRGLVDAGCHVAPVLTRGSLHFVGRTAFDALASEPAQMALFDGPHPVPHTRLGQQADLVVVAPATAKIMGKYAAGISDDLLSATLLATRAPVLLAPAMHTEMWEHPAVQANLATLVARGVHTVGPVVGRLAGGDVGAGRLADPSAIVAAALGLLQASGDLVGRRILVTAGGTREPIDAVRVITNRSSGKQGYAVAAAAAARGAEVVLITTVDRAVPAGVRTVAVETAAEMEAAVAREAPGADAVVMAAAVADFRPKAAIEGKAKKADGPPEIILEPTPDILLELGRAKAPGQVLVGFAAETADVERAARAKLSRKHLDLIVANDVSAPDAGFEVDTNRVLIVDADGGVDQLPLASKLDVAHRILDRVAALLAAH